MPVRPSYRGGFAPETGLPRYPELWHGCVGAWAPCLGPTGLALKDWSGRKGHGTLTNMEVDADWLMSRGAYSLNFDGTDEFVSMPSNDTGLTSVSTFSAFCWVRTTASNNKSFFTKYQTTTAKRSFSMTLASTGWTTGGTPTGGELGVVMSNDGSNSPSTVKVHWTTGVTVNDGNWHHVGFTFDRGTLRLFVDGLERSTTKHQDPATTVIFWNDAPYSLATINPLGSLSNLIAAEIDDARCYKHVLTPSAIRLLSRYRGIAYEPEPRRYGKAAAAAAYRAYWARYNQLLGAGPR